MNAYEITEILAIIVKLWSYVYGSVLLSLRTRLCFSICKQVLKTLAVITIETTFLLAIRELINCT